MMTWKELDRDAAAAKYEDSKDVEKYKKFLETGLEKMKEK